MIQNIALESFFAVFFLVQCFGCEYSSEVNPTRSAPTALVSETMQIDSPEEAKMSLAIDSMSADNAIRAACDGVGIRKFERSAVKATKVEFSSESLPFLVDRLRNMPTWRVEFNNINLQNSTGDSKLANRFVSKLIVFLCPYTGHVMKVVSSWPSREPPIACYPSCYDEERQLTASSIAYAGLPAQPPKVTFLEALTKTMTWSPDVKQVFGCYVMESHLGGEEHPRWVIQLRGFPPFDPPRPPGAENVVVSEHARNHLREVIDSETGKWLYATTTPQPAGPLEDRY